MNYFYKYKVPNFETHKKNLLKLIYKIPLQKLHNSAVKVSHQDWSLPKDYKREYRKYFLDNILEGYVVNCEKNFSTRELKIDNIWFQVYEKGDFHSTHTHEQTHFTNVFYISLPDNNITKFYDFFGNPIDFDVTEGDIVTFPAFLRHGSKINTSEGKKVIISFNLNVMD